MQSLVGCRLWKEAFLCLSVLCLFLSIGDLFHLQIPPLSGNHGLHWSLRMFGFKTMEICGDFQQNNVHGVEDREKDGCDQ